MDRDELRIGDAEREQTMASLREHFAQGRLTHEELDERLDQTLAAKTVRDLAQVTGDLPGARTKEPAAPFPSQFPGGDEWRQAMRSYRQQMHQAHHSQRAAYREQRRGRMGRRGPGPIIPFLFVAMILALIFGGFAVFKVLLGVWIVAMLIGFIAKKAYWSRH